MNNSKQQRTLTAGKLFTYPSRLKLVIMTIIIVGMFVLMSGGMKIMEILFPLDKLSDQVSWYAGCIIGAFVGALVAHFLPKRISFVSILLKALI